MTRVQQYFGHLFFLSLLILSIVYYMERTIFLDSTNYILELVNNRFPDFSERPTAFLPLFLPWLAIVSGMSLKVALLLNSISYILLFYSVYLVCVVWLKNRTAGIVLILCQVLCVYETFYYTITEVHQAMAYSVLFYAWICSDQLKNPKFHHYLITGFILLLSIFSHPYALFMLIFVLGYSLLTKKHTFRFLLPIMLLMVLLVLSTAFIKGASSGEGQNYARLFSHMHYLSSFGDLPLLQFLGMHSWKYTPLYLTAEIFLVVTIVLQLMRRKIGLFLFTAGIIIAFIVTSSLMSPEGESSIVLEKSLLPIGFFVALSLVNELEYRKILGKWWVMIAILLVVVIRTRDIAMVGSKKFKHRIAYIHNVVEELQDEPGHKFIVQSNQIDSKIIAVSWAFALETLLYSAAQDTLEIKTVYIEKMPLKIDLSDSTIFLGPQYDPVISASGLNEHYFPLEGHYRYYGEDLLFDSK